MPQKCLRNTLLMIFSSIILGLLVSCSSTTTSTTLSPQINHTHIEEVLLDYAFSPDGVTLGIYTNKGIYLYDLITSHETAFIEFDNNNYHPLLKSGAIAFSHNGLQIAVSGRFENEPIKIFDTFTYEHISNIALNLPGYVVTELEFSPSGESIAIRNTGESGCGHGPQDKLVLYNFTTQKIAFEVDKCAIYPPIRFHFTKDEKMFFYEAAMGPPYATYFVDSLTGVIIERDCEWGEDDGFFGSSPEANIYLLQECFSTETSDEILSKGPILLFPNRNRYIVSHSANANSREFPIELWENGKRVCEFATTSGSPRIKASANEEIFAFGGSYLIERNTYGYQLFVWDVDSCEKIGVWQFDSS